MSRYWQIINRLTGSVFGTYRLQDNAKSIASSMNNDYQTDVYIVIERYINE